MSRSERRKNTWKHIKRQEKIYKSSGIKNDELIPHYFHKKSCWCCGCPACGNPRKYSGEKTLGEQRSEIDDILDLISDHFDNISDEQLLINLKECGYEES